MRTVIISCLLILLVSTAGCDTKNSLRPENDDTFYLALTPQHNSTAAGRNVTLVGRINSVENLFAVSFDVNFDTTVLSFHSAYMRSENLLGTSGSIGFLGQTEDGVSISLGRIQTVNNDNVSGRGSLFEITFAGKSAGSTTIVFDNVLIIDEDGVANPDLSNLVTRSSLITIN